MCILSHGDTGPDEPCGVPVTHATQPLPDLPEFPNHTPLLPHLLTTQTHTSGESESLWITVDTRARTHTHMHAHSPLCLFLCIRGSGRLGPQSATPHQISRGSLSLHGPTPGQLNHTRLPLHHSGGDQEGSQLKKTSETFTLRFFALAQFISQHRPRVLTTEEAKQLVSQEENI